MMRIEYKQHVYTDIEDGIEVRCEMTGLTENGKRVDIEFPKLSHTAWGCEYKNGEYDVEKDYCDVVDLCNYICYEAMRCELAKIGIEVEPRYVFEGEYADEYREDFEEWLKECWTGKGAEK